MAGKEDMRVFVGGLSWDSTDRQLEDAFSEFGKVLDAQQQQVMAPGRIGTSSFHSSDEAKAESRCIGISVVYGLLVYLLLQLW